MSVESRRRLAPSLLVLATQALLLTTGCTPSVPAAVRHASAVVVFIDFSGSITGDDRASYRREIESEILPSLSAGDRLLIAPIHDKTMTEFRPLVEDNPPYDFEKIAWSPATITKTLSELDAKGLVPKLPGVCIYVSGASAKSAELAENVGRFWQAYFRRTGADMDPSRYAHVLLH